jgi:hypothetical protein
MCSQCFVGIYKIFFTKPLRGLTAIISNISGDYHMNYRFARALKEREAPLTLSGQYEGTIKKVSRNAEVFTTRVGLGVKEIPGIFKKLNSHLFLLLFTDPCNCFDNFDNIDRFIAFSTIWNRCYKRTICF